MLGALPPGVSLAHPRAVVGGRPLLARMETSVTFRAQSADIAYRATMKILYLALDERSASMVSARKKLVNGRHPRIKTRMGATRTSNADRSDSMETSASPRSLPPPATKSARIARICLAVGQAGH